MIFILRNIESPLPKGLYSVFNWLMLPNEVTRSNNLLQQLLKFFFREKIGSCHKSHRVFKRKLYGFTKKVKSVKH